MSCFIHRDVIEVEQVAARIAAALIPDASVALDRAVGRGERSRPGRAASIRIRAPTGPSSLEVDILMVAARCGAKVPDRGAPSSTRDCRHNSAIDCYRSGA